MKSKASGEETAGAFKDQRIRAVDLFHSPLFIDASSYERLTMRRTVSLLLSLAIIFCTVVFPAASDVAAYDDDMLKAASYVLGAVKSPEYGFVGGEWAVIGLARCGMETPEGYFDGYYQSVIEALSAGGGVLSNTKMTEYSRVVLALSSIGMDVTSIGGYDLISPLVDFDVVVKQGITGPAWALIALDCKDYKTSKENGDIRQAYVDYMLSKQLEDGGFNLTGKGKADPDVTAMVLQALAKYQDNEKVKSAVETTVEALATIQNGDGSFTTSGTASTESIAQVLVALCELGLDPADARFVRNGKTLPEIYLEFMNNDGSFPHAVDDNSANLMAGEQGLYCLADLMRTSKGMNSLYRMDDAKALISEAAEATVGLPGKNADVTLMPVTKDEVSFSDIAGCDAKGAIEALASRGIISGFADGSFRPDGNMTRAQFASIVTLGLGLKPEDSGIFSDVKASAWYAGFVGTANRYGIVSGRGNGRFDPESTITKQEAAVMVANAAKLCGMDIAMDETATRNVLAQFGDYKTAATWARPFLAFCYNADILDQSELDIEPLKEVSRAEIAQMLYNMLGKARLL